MLSQNKLTPVNIASIKYLAEAPLEGNFFCLELVCRVHEIREACDYTELLLVDEYGHLNAIAYKKAKGKSRALKNYTFVRHSYVRVIGFLKKLEIEDRDFTVLTLQKVVNLQNFEDVHLHRTKVLWSFLQARPVQGD